MKLLCTSDIHRSAALCGNILKTIETENIDIFINAGDFLDNHLAYHFFKELDAKKTRSFITPGNWDRDLNYKSEHVTINNHGIFAHEDYHFLCIGPGTPFSLEEALDAVKDIDSEKLVMITHYPPYGILDRAWSAPHAGSMEYRRFISAKNPGIHIFGHIHESNGTEKIASTLAINCALAGHGMGRGYIVDLPQKDIKVVNLNETRHNTPFRLQSTISRIIRARKQDLP
ncbi:MAG: metallophosphoesterase [Candidatus Aenigmarchaeota archaeon]|nr:metallophosphoesterase [Candidatus Aenigmarchaeota archaeon]